MRNITGFRLRRERASGREYDWYERKTNALTKALYVAGFVLFVGYQIRPGVENANWGYVAAGMCLAVLGWLIHDLFDVGVGRDDGGATVDQLTQARTLCGGNPVLAAELDNFIATRPKRLQMQAFIERHRVPD